MFIIILCIIFVSFMYFWNDSDSPNSSSPNSSSSNSSSPNSSSTPPYSTIEDVQQYIEVKNQDYNSPTYSSKTTILQDCYDICNKDDKCLGFTRRSGSGIQDDTETNCWFHNEIVDNNGDDDNSRTIYIKQ